ncbi:MAG TPA: VanZ family protein [Povalibacter sp.]|uniref:VanZ family protein n=1 Tax=Povalibacter sp. TaxID=1962978 RepID=UPI002D1D88C4|nr:VanZ family protein [Povalibacter sp.]HMN44706.1 VanZ family protein [Povalibacter sp.]
MPTRSRSFVPWLLIAVVALIAYGSLYPFNLKPDAFDRSVIDALRELSWARAGRGDRIANVLLYLPLGFCLFLWLSSRVRRSAAIVVTVALGSLLSCAIEVAQVYISSRVPSLTDLTLNALGTLIGATAGMVWDKMGGLMHLPRRAEKPHRDPASALLIATWLLWRLAPFVPHFDLGKLKAALQPLFRPQIDLSSTLIWLTCWLVISQALATLVSRTHTLEALLIMIAAVLVGRLVVANQTFVASELVALVALVPIVVLMYRMTPGPKRLLLLAAMLAVFTFERLTPFAFTGPAPAFDFWPFLGWAAAGFPLDLGELFGTVFLFAALLWILRYAGTSFRLAAGIMLALVCATEFLQLWLPERGGSITDPAIALVVVLAFRYTQRRQRRMFTGRPVSRREHNL